jgi:hypothetical protein
MTKRVNEQMSKNSNDQPSAEFVQQAVGQLPWGHHAQHNIRSMPI